MTLTESSSVSLPCTSLVAFAGHDADPTVVWLRGDYDLSTAAGLREALARAIARDNADLVVDLGGVRFMDAATVGVIIWARNCLRAGSRSWALRSPSRWAQRVIDLCGLAGLVGPGPVDTARMPTAGGLGTWVTRPATFRVDRPVMASTPKVTVDSGRVVAAETELAVPDADLLAARPATNVTRRRGP
jgi:anti-anti-sigma factor